MIRGKGNEAFGQGLVRFGKPGSHPAPLGAGCPGVQQQRGASRGAPVSHGHPGQVSAPSSNADPASPAAFGYRQGKALGRRCWGLGFGVALQTGGCFRDLTLCTRADQPWWCWEPSGGAGAWSGAAGNHLTSQDALGVESRALRPTPGDPQSRSTSQQRGRQANALRQGVRSVTTASIIYLILIPSLVSTLRKGGKTGGVSKWRSDKLHSQSSSLQSG